MQRQYSPPKVDYKKRRKSVAIPDQSMTVQEIVKRYVRGVPVDVVQRQGVYVDQKDYDLEKLSRMDFGEKAELAEQLRAEAEQMRHEWQEAQARATEAKQKAVQEATERAQQKSAEGAKGAEGAKA